MISRRPDDVSQEEAKNLLALFDLCLAEEIRNSSEDVLSSKLLSTMAKLNLEVDFQEEVASIFSRAINGLFCEEEYRRLEFLLQSVAAKELSEEEHAELRRLEFMFALALPPGKKRASFEQRDRSTGALPAGCFALITFSGHSAGAARDSDDPAAKFRERVLWDVLGDARPRTVAELARVLRDRGIVLRHSP